MIFEELILKILTFVVRCSELFLSIGPVGSVSSIFLLKFSLCIWICNIILLDDFSLTELNY